MSGHLDWSLIVGIASALLAIGALVLAYLSYQSGRKDDPDIGLDAWITEDFKDVVFVVWNHGRSGIDILSARMNVSDWNQEIGSWWIDNTVLTEGSLPTRLEGHGQRRYSFPYRATVERIGQSIFINLGIEVILQGVTIKYHRIDYRK